MLNCVFPTPQINHQDARCQIYSRIKNKGFPFKLHKLAKKEKEKNSRKIWESWKPPVIFWKLDNHTIEFPKSFHFENLPRDFLREVKLHPTQQIFFMMKTKQAKNQNHPLPEKSSQFTQTAFAHNQGKNISDVEHLGARNPKWRKVITRSN